MGHIQSKSFMPTFTRFGNNLGDELALCQSHSYRLSRGKVVVLQLRGA